MLRLIMAARPSELASNNEAKRDGVALMTRHKRQLSRREISQMVCSKGLRRVVVLSPKIAFASFVFASFVNEEARIQPAGRQQNIANLSKLRRQRLAAFACT